ncbi:hypothetical protein RZS08_10125, partial [Arthrospira platensis SPKY1]|nr:hypothetical protein [Arthrospira platensis SPKY1]
QFTARQIQASNALLLRLQTQRLQQMALAGARSAPQIEQAMLSAAGNALQTMQQLLVTLGIEAGKIRVWHAGQRQRELYLCGVCHGVPTCRR